MWNKRKFKFNDKLISFAFFVLMIYMPVLTLAATGPGTPDDPSPCDFNGGVSGNSTTCPLDTWVWLLVAVAVILGAVMLSKKQKVRERI